MHGPSPSILHAYSYRSSLPRWEYACERPCTALVVGAWEVCPHASTLSGGYDDRKRSMIGRSGCLAAQCFQIDANGCLLFGQRKQRVEQWVTLTWRSWRVLKNSRHFNLCSHSYVLAVSVTTCVFGSRVGSLKVFGLGGLRQVTC